MKKYFAINLLILILILSSGCQTSPEAVEPPTTKVPTATTVPTITLEPSPTATDRVMTLEENVDAFRSGEIDFPTGLTTEQSIIFINEMENQRGPQPIFFEITDGSIWFMADENFLKDHPELASEIIEQRDGLYHASGDFLKQHPDIAKEITPKKYLPTRTDQESGNLQYLDDKTGEWVTIPDSANRDLSVVINKTNIKQAIDEKWLDWPMVNILGADRGEFAGMTGLQAMLAGSMDNKDRIYNLVLGFLEEKNTIEIPINFRQGGWAVARFLPTLIVTTDNDGKPLFITRAYVISAGGTTFYQEGSSELDYQGQIEFLKDEYAFDYIKLNKGGSIWMMINEHQDYMWENNELAQFSDLDGVVPASESFDNFVGKKTSDESLLVGVGIIVVGK